MCPNNPFIMKVILNCGGGTENISIANQRDNTSHIYQRFTSLCQNLHQFGSEEQLNASRKILGVLRHEALHF